MEPVVAFALLGAAFLHASWHAVVKGGRSQLATLAGMTIVAAVPALCATWFLPLPGPDVWPVLVVSVGLHVGYKLGLAAAYRRAELSQAYPLARGLVPPLAMALSFLALGETPTRLQVMAVAVICIAIAVLVADRTRPEPSLRLLAATAAVGLTAAGYSVLDAYGARLAPSWAAFTAWLIVLDGICFLAVARLISGRRIWSELAGGWRSSLVSGLLGLVSFGIFIWALSRAPVGTTAALRETSIFFAALIGMAWFGERLGAVRGLAVAAIAAGAMALALA